MRSNIQICIVFILSYYVGNTQTNNNTESSAYLSVPTETANP